MKVVDAVRGVRRVLFDSAPLIYLVERHPVYYAAVAEVARMVDTDKIEGVTSPVTLAECLVHPMRRDDRSACDDYADVVAGKGGLRFRAITDEEATLAARIRAQYGLKLADALQVAAAITAGCDALLTNDAHLKRVTEVRVLLVSDLEA